MVARDIYLDGVVWPPPVLPPALIVPMLVRLASVYRDRAHFAYMAVLADEYPDDLTRD